MPLRIGRGKDRSCQAAARPPHQVGQFKGSQNQKMQHYGPKERRGQKRLQPPSLSTLDPSEHLSKLGQSIGDGNWIEQKNSACYSFLLHEKGRPGVRP